ncbi:zinc finger CW-type PWWP domain protein 1-like [Belonocnema kinseyi]|uniref:zinc finger CW-type PWWP domain protein 1-like n=1 Tax=Belonocnema kinseyi TaxID=2817044 RepID=UPI00143CC3D5|nr:zinc finger CW-type PWWP domain protein 1-like [Belonocnema kinseyi]
MKQKRKRVQSLKRDPNDGLWIKCCNEKCKKWRFVTEYQDPLSVPETWFCSQNLDNNFSSCDIPEEETNENLIESKFNCGTVVWAKINGYPWWPAIIDNCPTTNKFYKLQGSSVPKKYHVTFFEKEVVEYAWVKPKNIKPFKEDDGQQPLKKAKLVYAEKDYEDLLRTPLKLARSAIALDIPERLKKYSLSARLNEDDCKKEVLQVAISQNTKKKARSIKRPKRNEGRVQYPAPNIDKERNEKETLRTVRYQKVIKPQPWNFCSIL